jgi:hypothetical protein
MKKNAQLDQALRRAVPESEMPPALHASIMRAVQGAGAPAPPLSKPSVLRWLSACVLIALIGGAWVWHTNFRAGQSRSAFERAGLALAASREVAQAAPVTALAPLTEEWQRLNQDLDNTAQFLLAALP